MVQNWQRYYGDRISQLKPYTFYDMSAMKQTSKSGVQLDVYCEVATQIDLSVMQVY